MKIIFAILGFIFMGLGILGIYLPLLPYTPFLILATMCFAKSSEKFNNWFINTNIYIKNVKPLVKKSGMTIKRKFKIISIVSIFFMISFFMMENIYGRICLIIVWIFHLYYFLIRVKTIEEAE